MKASNVDELMSILECYEAEHLITIDASNGRSRILIYDPMAGAVPVGIVNLPSKK